MTWSKKILFESPIPQNFHESYLEFDPNKGLGSGYVANLSSILVVQLYPGSKGPSLHASLPSEIRDLID